jgi:hypothetical protein
VEIRSYDLVKSHTSPRLSDQTFEIRAKKKVNHAGDEDNVGVDGGQARTSLEIGTARLAVTSLAYERKKTLGPLWII